MNNFEQLPQFIPISKLLTMLSREYWASYWNDKCELLQNYPLFIAAIKQKINAKATRVYIVSEDRAFFLAGFLAALQTNCTVIIPGATHVGVLEELLNSTDCLLTTQKDLSSITANVILLQEIDISQNLPITFKEVELEKNIIFYTSGSTGKKQPVLKQLRYIEAEVVALDKLWRNKEGSINYLSTVPHYHIYGFLFSLLWPVCSKRKLARTTFLHWEELFFSCVDGDYIISSPSHLSRISSVAKNITIEFSYIFSSGGFLSFKDANICKELLRKMPIEVYGSTESGGIGYRQQLAKEQPWTNFDGIEIKPEKNCTIIIKSPYLPAAQPLVINDLIQLISSHQFALIGRTDSVVKIEGKRVSLLEIQQRICDIKSVDNAMIIPIKPTTRYELAALVVLNEEGKKELTCLGKNDYVRCLKQTLSCFFDAVVLPRRWRFIEEMPTNAQGKTTKQLVEKYFSNIVSKV